MAHRPVVADATELTLRYYRRGLAVAAKGKDVISAGKKRFLRTGQQSAATRRNVSVKRDEFVTIRRAAAPTTKKKVTQSSTRARKDRNSNSVRPATCRSLTLKGNRAQRQSRRNLAVATAVAQSKVKPCLPPPAPGGLFPPAHPVSSGSAVLSPELQERLLFEFVEGRKVHAVHVKASVEVEVPLPTLAAGSPATDASVSGPVERPTTNTTQEQLSDNHQVPNATNAADALSAHATDRTVPSLPAGPSGLLSPSPIAPAAVIIQKRVEPLCDIFMTSMPRASPRLRLEARPLMSRADNTRQWRQQGLSSAAPEFGTMCYVMVGATSQANANLHEELQKERSAASTTKAIKKKRLRFRSIKNAGRRLRTISSLYTQPPAPGEVRVVIFDRDDE